VRSTFGLLSKNITDFLTYNYEGVVNAFYHINDDVLRVYGVGLSE
jgi:hypothetical protein